MMKASSLFTPFHPHEWHKSAPRTLRGFRPENDPADAWSAWTAHLHTRKEPGSIWSCFEDDGVLLWGDGAPLLDPELKAILAYAEQAGPASSLSSPVQQGLDSWLAAEASGAMTPEHRTASTLAWSYLAASIADAVSPDAWWELLARVIRIIDEAAGLAVEDQPVPHQLLAGEAALAVCVPIP